MTRNEGCCLTTSAGVFVLNGETIFVDLRILMQLSVLSLTVRALCC